MAEAQAEARSLMMASDNILKPADGHTVTMPSQDMILGLYYLSTVLEGVKGQGRVFYEASGHDESIYAMKNMSQHYLALMQYAMGDLKADDSPSVPAR